MGKALQTIRNMIRLNPNDRKSVEEVLQSGYFQRISLTYYDIYAKDVNNEVKPGLCVIISQEIFHDVYLLKLVFVISFHSSKIR